MNKDKGAMPLHEQQRAIHKAMLADMEAGGRFSKELLTKADELSESIFQLADEAFDFGRIADVINQTKMMNTFAEMLNVLLVDAKKQ